MSQAKIIDAAGEQLWVGYSDAVRAAFSVGAAGDLTITPSGGDIALAAAVDVTSLSAGGVAVLTAARVLQNVTADAGILTAGSIADARVPASAVTQHQAALAIAWSQVTGEPTTLSGYGITDAYTRTQADAAFSAIGHVHAAGDITSGILGVARGGTGLGALGTANQVLRVNAGATGLEFASIVADAFASVSNSAGTVQFSASGADALQFAAGADMSVAFDAATKRVTFAYTGAGSGITRGYADITGNTGTAAATGADTLSIVGAGGITTAAAEGTPDSLTITLDSVAIAKISATGTRDATTFLRGDGTWATAGVDLTANYAWTGTHTFSKNVGVGIAAVDMEVWNSSIKAIEGSTGAFAFFNGQPFIFGNAYLDSAAYRYKTAAAATLYQGHGGKHIWYVAPSGTADTAITWTAALALNNDALVQIDNRAVIGGSSASSVAKTLTMHNVSTLPAAVTGAGVLYVDAGALYFKGSAGTSTKIANA